jgi:hypothetical protein
MTTHPLAPWRECFEIRGEKPFRSWQAKVPAGDYIVSVVAGDGLYSEPREWLDDPLGYSHYEIAVFSETERFFCPPELARWENHFDPGSSQVAGYVEAGMLADMLRALFVRAEHVLPHLDSEEPGFLQSLLDGLSKEERVRWDVIAAGLM